MIFKSKLSSFQDHFCFENWIVFFPRVYRTMIIVGCHMFVSEPPSCQALWGRNSPIPLRRIIAHLRLPDKSQTTPRLLRYVMFIDAHTPFIFGFMRYINIT